MPGDEKEAAIRAGVDAVRAENIEVVETAGSGISGKPPAAPESPNTAPGGIQYFGPNRPKEAPIIPAGNEVPGAPTGFENPEAPAIPGGPVAVRSPRLPAPPTGSEDSPPPEPVKPPAVPGNPDIPAVPVEVDNPPTPVVEIPQIPPSPVEVPGPTGGPSPGMPGIPSAPSGAPTAPSVGVPSTPMSGSSTPSHVYARRAEYCQCHARYTATTAERVPTLHGRGGVEGSRAGSNPAAAAVSANGWGADRPTRYSPNGSGCTGGTGAISDPVGRGPHRWHRSASRTRPRPRRSSRAARPTGPTSDTTSCRACRICAVPSDQASHLLRRPVPAPWEPLRRYRFRPPVRSGRQPLPRRQPVPYAAVRPATIPRCWLSASGPP